MHMHDIGVSCGTTGSASEREQEEWNREHEPRATLDVSEYPVPVRQPVVAKRRRRDDLDLEPGRANVLDRVANEDARDVVGPARVGRREDDDAH